ncbi:MAG TPA: pyridoxamine 5'-phosphate oxidase family protein [Anaerolineales bacterium]
MTDDPTAAPINRPRRQDRTVEDPAWIENFLSRASYGSLATVKDDQPFINTNLFVYAPDRHAIYLHTAREGRTRLNIEANPRVCFSVSEMGHLLPATTALEFSVEYAGVMVFGTAQVVSDPAEARDGLQRLLDKYFAQFQPGRDYRAIQPEELARTAVYRIDIESWSAKRKAVPADFPGAFFYGQQDKD